jgi:hypothetical protein
VEDHADEEEESGDEEEDEEEEGGDVVQGITGGPRGGINAEGGPRGVAAWFTCCPCVCLTMPVKPAEGMQQLCRRSPHTAPHAPTDPPVCSCQWGVHAS